MQITKFAVKNVMYSTIIVRNNVVGIYVSDCESTTRQ